MCVLLLNRLSIDGHVAADDVGDDVKICGSCKWALLFNHYSFLCVTLRKETFCCCDWTQIKRSCKPHFFRFVSFLCKYFCIGEEMLYICFIRLVFITFPMTKKEEIKYNTQRKNVVMSIMIFLSRVLYINICIEYSFVYLNLTFWVICLCLCLFSFRFTFGALNCDSNVNNLLSFFSVRLLSLYSVRYAQFKQYDNWWW